MLWSGFSEATLKSLIEFCLSGDSAPKTAHITRLYMYSQLKGKLSHLTSGNSRCLSISGSVGLIHNLGLRNADIFDAAYPDFNMLNLHQFKQDSFDVVASDQVLEHIEGDPFIAIAESVRVTKPGGYIAHTTCFINSLHGAPNDYWRFSEDSLKLLMETNGCSVVHSGSWGNREVWSYIDLGFRMRPIPNNPNNPIYQLAMKNEAKWFPLDTWVIAQKL